MIGDGAARLLAEVRLWGRLVKFSHTIFALPFALAMLLVASRRAPVSARQCWWILLALVSARTAAMAYNRIVDREIDARNRRTQARELPTRAVRLSSVWLLVLGAGALFFLSAAALGSHCLFLAPLVLGFLLFYSWTKRFTNWSHLILGVALSLAPGGAWYAITAEISLFPVPLMLGVMFWVGGFDILYSCQDLDFDRQSGLRSVPAWLGIERACLVAACFHLFALLALGFFGLSAGFGAPYFVGLGLFGFLLASEHALVAGGNLQRINAAFFSRNGAASLVFLAAVCAEIAWR